MNYTREPIIETVISPKDGCKLLLRSSKGGSREEFFIEALEIVNFSGAIFYRSLERPKSFLLPVSDYEVLEVRDTKMVLKNATIAEKSIKIGSSYDEEKSSKKKKRSRNQEKPQEVKGGGQNDETQVSSSVLRKLFPPPPNLIKEKLNPVKGPEKIDESISEEIVKQETIETKLEHSEVEKELEAENKEEKPEDTSSDKIE